MGTPVTIEIVDKEATEELLEEVFAYFRYVDEKFSIYKETSEITAINRGVIAKEKYSEDMKTVFDLSEETKRITNGYFDIITPEGYCDPSGLVKGWSIYNAAQILKKHNINNFYVEAGGDIQACGHNRDGKPWVIGIQNPFNKKREIVKALHLTDKGVATSGSYVRGQHIYNPVDKKTMTEDIVSLTVIGSNIHDADRFATAAFAMGNKGIHFIENLSGFEGYSIDLKGVATMTTGFNTYTEKTYA